MGRGPLPTDLGRWGGVPGAFLLAAFMGGLVFSGGTNDRMFRAYDAKNGKVLWECGGLSSNIVASPVSADGMVFAGSSYDKRALVAIRLDGAKGDITDTDRVVWSRYRGTPYVPSPLL